MDCMDEMDAMDGGTIKTGEGYESALTAWGYL